MKRVELKNVTGFLKRITAVIAGTESKKTMAVLHRNSNHTTPGGGICRTPADSAVLRVNAQPWA